MSNRMVLDFRWYGPEVQTKTTKQINALLDRIGFKAMIRMRQKMHEPKSGRKYARLPQRSSAAGQAPRSQSGRMSQALDYQFMTPLRVRIGVTKKAPYIEYLEQGSKHIKPRPLIEKTIVESITEVVGEGGK